MARNRKNVAKFGEGGGGAITTYNRKDLGMSGHSTISTDDAAARLQIDYWALDRLIPFARNARTHSAAQVAEIAGSIRTFSPIRFWSAKMAISLPATAGWRPPANSG